MQYIINNSNDCRYNLALEEYLFSNSEQDCLMLWQNSPSVIIGRFQNTAEEINAEYIRENYIDVVRRMTGGGAVYHDLGNLNFTFIEKHNSKKVDMEMFSLRMATALAKLGLAAELSGRNDLLIAGKKFSGGSQYKVRDKVLHHGTILYNANLTALENALSVKREKLQSKGIQSIRSRVANLSDYLAENLTVQEFAGRLLSVLLDPNDGEYRLSDADNSKINGLREQRYNNWAWNYGESPAFNVKKMMRFPFGMLQVYMDVEDQFITNCRIYGDFFSDFSTDNVEKVLIGRRLERNELADAIRQIDITAHFPGIQAEDFLNLLFRNNQNGGVIFG